MLSKEETLRRLELFMGYIVKEIDLPLPMQMAVRQFLPMTPNLLQNEEQRQKLRSLLSSIAWVMGYQLQLVPEEQETTGEILPLESDEQSI